MNTVVGLPIPRLSYDRFVFQAEAKTADACNDSLAYMELLTDSALFDAVGVRVAFTNRFGGVSNPPYDFLNLGTHVEDDAHAVLENRRRLLSALDSSSANLIVPNQVHGTEIVTIFDPSECDQRSQDADQGADGLIVSCNDVAALLCFADCMPVILVSPSGAFSVVHAGWRGVYGHIAVKALASLCKISGCNPSECNAYIGPFIHSECFEVGADLAQKFSNEFGSECVIDPLHVDLEIAMRSDLVKAGMENHRIASSGICTVCNSEKYYSYRASGGVCGRHGAIAVKPSR